VPPREYDDGTLELFQWGHDIEPIVARRFHQETGLHVLGEQTWCEHPDKPWMRCTLDGKVYDHPALDRRERDQRGVDSAPLGVLEIKTEGWGRKWETIPPDHQAQGFWQMAVTGLDQVWFAVLHGRRLEVYPLARNDAEIAYIVERAERFWHEYVLTGNPPPTDGTTATLDALTAIYPESRPGTVAALDDVAGALTGLRAAREDKRAAEEAERACKAIIAATLADAEEGTLAGQTVVTYRSHERRDLDAALLRAEHPRIYRRYERTGTVRTLRFTQPPKKEQQKP